MKNMRFTFFIFMMFLPWLTQGQALWQENTHYKVIKDQASEGAQVKEVFSFWCPHCFTFESIAKQMKSQLPENATFTKAHVDFLGGASKETQQQATAALLAARAMKDENRFVDAMFKAIHNERNSPDNLADIVKIYSQAGGDGEKLQKLVASFGIKGQIKKNAKLNPGLHQCPCVCG